MKDLLKGIGVFGVISMIGNFMRYLRKHRKEPFNPGELIAGMLVAWFIGALTFAITTGLGLHTYMSAGLAGAAGYCGGSLLDVVEESMRAAIKKLFKV